MIKWLSKKETTPTRPLKSPPILRRNLKLLYSEPEPVESTPYDIYLDWLDSVDWSVEPKLLGTTTQLEDFEVMDIYNRAWVNLESQEKIGREYGITRNAVSNIKTGLARQDVTSHIRTKDIKPRSTNLTKEQILEIYRLAWDPDVTTREIVQAYPCSIATVSYIKHGRSHSKITGHQRS